MPFRLQCVVCGEKSIAIETLPPNEKEAQAIGEFKLEHEATCGPASLETTRPIPQCGPFGSNKPPPQAVLKPHGHFFYTGPYGEQQEGDTLSCSHCGAHWQVRVGSGKKRGFCTRCNGYTCGRKQCDECIPFEQQLENEEAGLPRLTPGPARVLVPKKIGE